MLCSFQFGISTEVSAPAVFLLYNYMCVHASDIDIIPGCDPSGDIANLGYGWITLDSW